MPSSAIQILLAGFFSQLLCLGVARFAYTPLLGVMQAEGLAAADGAYLAAVNYLGYLSGAVLAMILRQWRHKFIAYRTGLVLAVLTTWMMSWPMPLFGLGLSRYLAGLSSAASMLLASGLILQHMQRLGRRPELGMHFAGLGLGIAVVAVAAEWLLRHGLTSSSQWQWLTGLALLLFIPAWRWLPPPVPHTLNANTFNPPPLSARFRRWLFLSYFCAGYGYVVTITFLVAMAQQQPELSAIGNGAFALLGLAAAVATLPWDWLARRYGYLASLQWALLLNGLAIAGPLFSASAPVFLACAALFGLSFIGCVSLMLTLAGRLLPQRPAQLMGKLTLFYGIAQTLAPALSGLLLARTGSYQSSLVAATLVVAVGVLALRYLQKLTPANHLARQGLYVR